MQERENELADRFAVAHFGRHYVFLNSINRAFCRNLVRNYLGLDYPLLGD